MEAHIRLYDKSMSTLSICFNMWTWELVNCINCSYNFHQHISKSVKKCPILICIFGRNPNRPYDVHQLFGNGQQHHGSQHLSGNNGRRVVGDKVKRTWESYQIESQKYLRIGNTQTFQYVEPRRSRIFVPSPCLARNFQWKKNGHTKRLRSHPEFVEFHFTRVLW